MAESSEHPCLLSDRVPANSIMKEAELECIMKEADESNRLLFIYKFSKLQPDEELPRHLKRLIESGEDYPGPWHDETLVFATKAMIQLYKLPSFEAMQKFMGAFHRGHGGSGQSLYWSSKPSDGRGQSGNTVHMTQVWDTITKDIVAGNYRPHSNPLLIWGTPLDPSNPSKTFHAVHIPLTIVDAAGDCHFGFMGERFPIEEDTQIRMWYLRYLQTVKNTPVALTVLSSAGNVLSQNSASMAMYGSHGLYNRQMNIPGRHDSDEILPLSLEYRGGVYADEEGLTFLDLLFHSSPNELKSLKAATLLNGHFTTRLAITSKILRSLCMLEEGEESHHDLQISMARDPNTLESIFIISQIDVTQTVRAQREVEEANAKLAKEMERIEALVERQYQLIEVLRSTDQVQALSKEMNEMRGSSPAETKGFTDFGTKISSIRESLLKSGLHDPSQSTEINLQSVIVSLTLLPCPALSGSSFTCHSCHSS